MDQIWLASPAPALRLWPGGRGASWRLNPAAQAWGRALRFNEAAWAAVAAELAAAHTGGAAREGRLVSAACAWRSLPMSTGWLVWLVPERAGAASIDARTDEPLTPADAPAEAVASDDLPMPYDVALGLLRRSGRIGFFERDLQTGVGRWDPGMFRLFGLNPADGPPSVAELTLQIELEDRARFTAAHEQAVVDGSATAGPSQHAEAYRMMVPHGSPHVLQTFAEVAPSGEGRPAVMRGVVVDDTESAGRIRAQAALTAQLAKALRLAEVSLWRIDLRRRRVHLSDVGFALAGLEPDADGVPLATLRRLAHPDDVPALVRASSEAMRGEAVVDVEARFPGRAGEGYRCLLTRRVAERDCHGRVVGLLGIALDQTDRIAERERSQALAQRIEMVVDTAGVGLWSVDMTSGVVEWNGQMFSIHGVSGDTEPPGGEAYCATLVHPDDREGVLRQLQIVSSEAESSGDTEFRIVRPDGETRRLQGRWRLDRRGGHSVVGGLMLDVTERHLQRELAERALRDKEAAERASNAKSELLAHISHELRTPLNAVLGFAQLIEHQGGAVPMAVQLERVAHIRQAGEQLRALIGDVLERLQSEGRSDEDTAPAPPDATAPAVSAAPSLSVLYIEDNPVNVILVEQLVAMRANTTLHCATDGLSGVALAESRRPDVVLVDMQLPDIDGFEVLRRLRRLTTLDGAAIIALSANSMSDDIALARAAGFDEYWTKPIDFRHFLSGLDALAEKR